MRKKWNKQNSQLKSGKSDKKRERKNKEYCNDLKTVNIDVNSKNQK
jgi:hypothetical protein